MLRSLLLPLLLLGWAESLSAQVDSRLPEIVLDPQATALETLAAREIRRYVYVRTGALLEIRSAQEWPGDGRAIVVGTAARDVVQRWAELDELLTGLEPEQYLLRSVGEETIDKVLVVGGDAVGTLYAAYRFAEQLGVRFYLHGDVIPDEPLPLPLQLPDVNETSAPLFRLRGIQPFHDFPEGPDWWDTNDYRAILAQLPKMRLNFFGLHTYPEGGVGPEPAVWIGPPEDLDAEGRVKASYPSRHFVTRNVTAAWGYQPRDTGDYAFGAAAMFDRDNYGAEYMEGTHPWPEMDTEAANALFHRFGQVLRESFMFARQLGVKTCVGTETPLVLPQAVRRRLVASGRDPDDPSTTQLVYEGMFRRIMAAYPIDYYWLWTPEHWTWQDVPEEQVAATLADFHAVTRAAAAAEVPFQLATCGWVLGPPRNSTLFDGVLPASWPLSCINRNVGHDPVEAGFARVEGRSEWAIPWLEDDPALIVPQLWVGRLRKDAADALRYGCDGLLGIHWRTRILAPNVAALARAGWSQQGWKTPDVDRDPPPWTGTFEERRESYPAWRSAPCDDFYQDWATAEFGARAGPRIAPLFAQLDGRLPRPSTWVGGPGGIVPDPRPWAVVRSQYDFVDDLREMRPLVTGAGHQQRFDYWLDNFRYLRGVATVNCTWAELNAALTAMEQAADDGARKRLAQREALPLRLRLIRQLKDVHQYLLQTVSTKGAMGTVANWQQHLLPLLLDDSEKAITRATGEPLPALAQLPREYPGVARLFVPVVRTSLCAGESLRIPAVVLGTRPVVAQCYWRTLGAESFRSAALTHRARGVYEVELPPDEIEGDLEYYLEVTADDQQLRFPVTAPALNQTVVLIPPME